MKQYELHRISRVKAALALFPAVRRQLSITLDRRETLVFLRKSRDSPLRRSSGCKGGNLSAVVRITSRRPLTFSCLRVGRVAHSLQSNEKSLYLQKCQSLWIRDLQTR